MNHTFVSLCTSAVPWASLFLIGCPVLQAVQVPCESSLDCPTNFGCGSNQVCSQGLAESVLTVEPAKASLGAAASTAFTAKLDGQTTTNVTWSVEGALAGTINGSGVYTAPSGITAVMKVKVWAALKRHSDLKASASLTIAPPDNTVAWVMSYFQNGSLPKNVAQDSLHLAYSTDGLEWTPLAPRTPAYRLTNTGSNHLRDPVLFRKQDGTFVLLASDWTRSYTSADYWSSPSPDIVVADSADLITFTNLRLLRVTPIQDTDGIPMHAWGPEAFYDPDLGQYGIIWSGNDVNNVNRIYVSYTMDFQTLVNTDPIVFFDPGYSVTDATLVRTDARNYLLFKDASDNNGGPSTGSGQDIQIARSASTELTPGSFTRWSPAYVTRGGAQSTRTAAEGPFVIKLTQVTGWTMCANLNAPDDSFGCWSTSDVDANPLSWTRLSSKAYAMPPKAQNASTVRVTQAELDALIASYGTLGTVKIKSTAVDVSGRPLYLVHSWFHGIITFDTDTASGQLATDFPFSMSPSLALPNDAAFVSFESPGVPGRWLRVNSTKPNAWVSGEALTRSNQSQYLSEIPEDKKNHLLWLDAFESTTAYAMDATFKIVAPALNGDSSMVSLMWCGESVNGTCGDIADPRYLCHSYFQVFAYHATDPCGVDPNHPGSTSPDDVKKAMSFTLVGQK